MNYKPILILGTSGFLGKILLKKLKDKMTVENTGVIKRKFNLKKYSDLKKILKKKILLTF